MLGSKHHFDALQFGAKRLSVLRLVARSRDDAGGAGGVMVRAMSSFVLLYHAPLLLVTQTRYLCLSDAATQGLRFQNTH